VLKLTNHSDFADPAKKYLRECQGQAPPSLPASGGNGRAAASSVPETSAEEFNS